MSSRSRGRGRGYMGRGGGGFGGSSHHRGDDRRGGGFHRGGRGFRGGGNANFSHRGSSQEHRGMSRHREDHPSSRDHHNSGRNDRHPPRREDSSSRGREEYMGPRKPRSPPHPHPSSYRKTDQILSKLAPDEQEALTKALIDTVLQKTQGRESRSFRDDHDGRSRDHSRDMNDRRPSRYMGREFHRGSREGFRGGGYRGRGGRGNRHDNGPHTRLGMHEQPMRRKFDDEDEFCGPPHKRTRLSEDQPGKDDSRNDGYDRQKSFGDRDRGGSGPQFRRQLFELNCPHCVEHVSITMDDYKYHLSSKLHEKSMERLSRTHSQMLLRMRREQRTQQKELEEDYLKQNPDQAEISITKFCSICKLNFRCLGGDVKEGLVAHCKSRLHKMQQNYLHPRCVICSAVSDDPKRRFKSRMVYEHHVASISHMKRKNESLDKLPEELVGDDAEDVNLDGFMTVDSVGDEEMPCDEGEETVKESEEGEKPSEENTEEMVEEETTEGDPQINTEGEKEGSFKPVGISYVKAVKVFFCKLCFLNIKDGGIKRHCGTPAHRNKYFELMKENEEKEAKLKKEEAGEGKEEKEGESDKSKDEGGEKVKEEADISEKEYETYNNKYNRFNEEEEEDEEEVDFEGVFNEEGEEDDEEQDLWNEVEDDLQAVTDTNEETAAKKDKEEDHNGMNESEKMEEETDEKKEIEEDKPAKEISADE